jgi:hypothetical protein
MDSLISYLIRSVLVSGLLAGYYAIALRGRRMHGFNRFYLLSSVVLALVLPLMRIHWNPWPTGHGSTVERVLIGMAPAATGKSGIALWWWLGLGSSVLVTGALLLISIGKIRGILALKRRSVCTPMDGYALVETEAPGTPFSFLRNLFWGKGVDRENVVNRKMLAHELAHIRGRHSWDILGMQTVVCIFWMNPFFWYIRRELNLVLEFTADAASGADGDPELLARMLLQVYTGGHSPTLANAFFHSPIKRRLVMITNNTRSRRTWMRKALVAPVLAAAVLFFACSKEQPAQLANTNTDALKLKVDSIQVRFIKLLPIDLKLAKFKNLTPEEIDNLKLKVKVTQDSFMKVYYQPAGDNRIGVKANQIEVKAD